MTEPAIAVEPGAPEGVEIPAAGTPVCGPGFTRSRGTEAVRSACRSLTVFGTWARWGFAALGILNGAIPLAELASTRAESALWVRACAQALFAVLAFMLAGWGVATLSRLAAAAVLEILERGAHDSDDRSMRASQRFALLERIAVRLEKSRESVGTSSPSETDRARSIAEIGRAARAVEWVEAQTRLSEFEHHFPEDPELPRLKEELARTRDEFVKSGIDQLDAARAVHDADRVLEIHRSLVPSLDEERRAALDQDLAKWFLSLIHRRLRTGKVQLDVVQLAARFAENFAATVEGASVRASLATLRRSVGLCPQCGQPYAGPGDACPNCKKGGTHSLSSAPSNTATGPAE